LQHDDYPETFGGVMPNWRMRTMYTSFSTCFIGQSSAAFCCRR
jgi:hypothetical protein